MIAAILGRKIGMTRLYDKSGKNIPVTIIQAGPCFISQIKTVEIDGYSALQLAYCDIKPRNSTIPIMRHDSNAGLSPKQIHKEFRVSDKDVTEVELGGKITVEAFEGIEFLDITGTSKGRGFSGGMRRWGFKGQLASHGVERKHRSPGSIGGRSSNLGTGKPKKGIRMAGQFGNVKTTARSLGLIGHDKDRDLLMVKGAVPGANYGLLLIRQAKRLNKQKMKMAVKS